ncbi:MAG: hypothetical protein AAGE52_30745 [Myxococcota bacterium]
MGKVFGLEILQAFHGDCLLLHHGTDDGVDVMVVDGGPTKTYKKHLRPRLLELRDSRVGDQTFNIEVMVSHADGDHIQGIIELAEEIEERFDDGDEPLLDIFDLWHNSFDDVFGNAASKIAAALSQPNSFGTAVAASHHGGAFAASIKEGRTLRRIANRMGWSVNQPLGVIRNDMDAVAYGDGLTLTVVGPLAHRYEALHEKWDKEVKKHGWSSGDAAAASRRFDTSVTNLSSIVCMAEMGGKSILLTGDARGDDIVEGLESLGYLDPGGSMTVDVLKVPHHGSDRNVSTEFFRRVKAKNYVISGDGSHHNPDETTLDMIVRARGHKARYTVHMTNRTGKFNLGDSIGSWLSRRPSNAKWKASFGPTIIDLVGSVDD